MPSTVVASMTYIPETATLRVIYVSGNIYDYLKVPKKVYEEMKASGSKGKFLNEVIKKQYAYHKVLER